MGLFKKKIFKTDEQKKAESLPRTKKVQFESQRLSDVELLIDNDINAVLSFNPVNYYATKNKYLQCMFYYAEDYSEIYMVFESYGNDRFINTGKYRKIEFSLFKSILRKFGVNLY